MAHLEESPIYPKLPRRYTLPSLRVDLGLAFARWDSALYTLLPCLPSHRVTQEYAKCTRCLGKSGQLL